MTIVDILDDGGVPEFGASQAGSETTVVALGDFTIDHEAESLVGRQGVDVRHIELLLIGPGHAGQAQGMEFIEGGVF